MHKSLWGEEGEVHTSDAHTCWPSSITRNLSKTKTQLLHSPCFFFNTNNFSHCLAHPLASLHQLHGLFKVKEAEKWKVRRSTPCSLSTSIVSRLFFFVLLPCIDSTHSCLVPASSWTGLSHCLQYKDDRLSWVPISHVAYYSLLFLKTSIYTRGSQQVPRETPLPLWVCFYFLVSIFLESFYSRPIPRR